MKKIKLMVDGWHWLFMEAPEKDKFSTTETATRELQNIVKSEALNNIELMAKIARVIKETKK